MERTTIISSNASDVRILDFGAILNARRILRQADGTRIRVLIDGFSARTPNKVFVTPTDEVGTYGAQREVSVASIIWQDSDFYVGK